MLPESDRVLVAGDDGHRLRVRVEADRRGESERHGEPAQEPANCCIPDVDAAVAVARYEEFAAGVKVQACHDAIPADHFGPLGPEGPTGSHLEDANPGEITREGGQATVVRQDELRSDEPRRGTAAGGTQSSGRLELREGGAPL